MITDIWGIVVEWDEDGLECCRWLELDLYRHGAITKRVEFELERELAAEPETEGE